MVESNVHTGLAPTGSIVDTFDFRSLRQAWHDRGGRVLYCTVNKILHSAGTMMIVTHIEDLVHARMGLALKDKVSDSEVVEPWALYVQTMILFAPAVRFVGPKGQELLWHQRA